MHATCLLTEDSVVVPIVQEDSEAHRDEGFQAEHFSPNKDAGWPHLLPVNSNISEGYGVPWDFYSGSGSFRS